MHSVATVIFLCVSLSQSSMVLKSFQAPWNHFVISQFWPPGICNTSKKPCVVPKQVNSWTIHGLWPTQDQKKAPVYCNCSLPFNISEIEYLRPNLTEHWPNLFNKTDYSKLWAHEWDKHGTCCLDLPAVSGEKNYFMTALNLNNKFNIMTMLNNSGIVPRHLPYMVQDFRNAVKNATGYEPIIACYPDKDGKGLDVIVQIQICLCKNFQPILCNTGGSDSSLKYSPKAPKIGDTILSHHNEGHLNSVHYESSSELQNCSTILYPPIEH